MSSRGARLAVFVVLAALAVAGAAAAQQLTKLPPDRALPQSGDSPGKVVFSHEGHVAVQAKPDCTVCHPKLAPILKPAAQVKREPLTHAKMLKGQACGACHNGKDARGFDDCAMCHK
jgi:c(7)-type cytochrome triheme protein